MFKDREDAGRRLADELRGVPLRDPLVLAIPRGGVVVGAELAKGLGADLDVVLSRKLRSPEQPELALGAISESGEVYLTRHAAALTDDGDGVIEEERRRQSAEIDRLRKVFRAVREREPAAGRSVIITDDGIATGSTLIAALHTVRAQRPHELIAAVPVAPPDRLKVVRELCDRLVCLASPESFWAVGQFYENFDEVSDSQVVELLRAFGEARRRG